MSETREDHIETAVYALNGILPGAACYTTADGRDLVRFSGRSGSISVDVREMAARVVDALEFVASTPGAPPFASPPAGGGVAVGEVEPDLDADINDCCHGVEGPCHICDPDLFDEAGVIR